MNLKWFIFYLIALAIFIMLHTVWLENDAKEDCNKIKVKKFNCVVLKKEVIIDDHGLREITCYDLDSNYLFYFYPYDISPANIIYHKIEVGDTLLKDKNAMYFLIVNNNKRDTFKFDCNFNSED